jgi:hypothetical protein
MTKTGTVHLQHLGNAAGTPVGAVSVGDVLVWNQGTTSTVVDLEEASAKFLFVTTDTRGQRCTRKMKKDRLVVVAP